MRLRFLYELCIILSMSEGVTGACHAMRTVFSPGVPSHSTGLTVDNAPQVRVNQTVQTMSSAKKCAQLLSDYDFIDLYYTAHSEYRCELLSFSKTGIFVQIKGFGIFCGDSTPDWIAKPDFTQVPSNLSTDTILAIGGMEAVECPQCVNVHSYGTWSLTGNLSSTCLASLDNCQDGVTYSMWIKMTNTREKSVNETVYYLSSGGEADNSEGIAFFARNGYQNWWWKTSRAWWKQENQVQQTLDRWQHVIATWSKDFGFYIYTNGLLEATNNSPDVISLPYKARQLLVGRPSNPINYLEFGEFIISDFRVYYRYLHEDDAKSLFKNRFS